MAPYDLRRPTGGEEVKKRSKWYLIALNASNQSMEHLAGRPHGPSLSLCSAVAVPFVLVAAGVAAWVAAGVAVVVVGLVTGAVVVLVVTGVVVVSVFVAPPCAAPLVGPSSHWKLTLATVLPKASPWI